MRVGVGWVWGGAGGGGEEVGRRRAEEKEEDCNLLAQRGSFRSFLRCKSHSIRLSSQQEKSQQLLQTEEEEGIWSGG